MTILFDFDEVFVDINTGALEYINNKLGTHYTLEDIKSWDFFNDPVIRPHFVNFLGISDVYQRYAIPNKAMINVCDQLIKMGEDVYIVTASLEHSHASKLRFIQEYMPFISLDKVFVINETSPYKYKSDVLSELSLDYRKPIILVDDGIHNILDMMADIKHKDKLDRTMKQFYQDKLLKKYNNPYHDFIYGIVPELTYNRDLDDGKRIFKIQHATDIWKILAHIKDTHSYRINSKYHEIIGYLNNILTPYVQNPMYVSQLQTNFTYLMNHGFAKNHSDHELLTEVGKLSILIDNLSPNMKMPNVSSIFESAESLFSSIMYDDVRNLILPVNNHRPSEVTSKLLLNNANGTLLTSLITINKRNVELVDNVSKLMAQGKNTYNKLLFDTVNSILFNEHTGINNIECLADPHYLRANLLLILNKNIVIENNTITHSHASIEYLVKALTDTVSNIEYTPPNPAITTD